MRACQRSKPQRSHPKQLAGSKTIAPAILVHCDCNYRHPVNWIAISHLTVGNTPTPVQGTAWRMHGCSALTALQGCASLSVLSSAHAVNVYGRECYTIEEDWSPPPPPPPARPAKITE